MTDMEYTLDERVIRKPTHDTPEAALAAALFSYAPPPHGPAPWFRIPADRTEEHAAAILAALDGWELMPVPSPGESAGYDREQRLEAKIARLRAAIQAVLDDAESQHPGGWGPDVTTVGILRAALEGEP